MGIRFFYLPKHRKFNYIPRVYDPDKERRKIYKKDQSNEVNVNTEDYTGYSERIKGAIKRHSISLKKVSVYSQLTRLIIIMILISMLFAGAYLIFKYLMLI